MSNVTQVISNNIDIQDVKDYLGITWDDAAMERRLTRLLRTADAFLVGALGENYPKSDPRCQELALMIVADLYDHRELSQKEKYTYRKMASDFELQIRLEMRK